MARQYHDGRRTPPSSQPGRHPGGGYPGMHSQHGHHAVPGLHGAHGAHAKSAPRSVHAQDSSDEEPEDVKTLHSTVVHGIAGDIHHLESRCDFLEDRNKWLTGRLLQAQKKFISRSVLSGGKMKMQASFQGWKGALAELRLERHLHEQAVSLEQCQHVARELSEALTQEQDSRSATESAHSGSRMELQKALDEQKHFHGTLQAGARRIELLEKRVHDAEAALMRFRSHAQTVVDSANHYERQVRDLQHEVKQESDDFPPHPENPLEHSSQLREQAQGTMQKVAALLHHAHHRTPTPERN